MTKIDRALIERRRNLALEADAKARAESQAVADGVAETLSLDERRGAVFHRPPVGRGERAKPAQRLDGLDWLAAKGRLTRRQAEAGRRYGRLVQVLEGGQVGSCLALFEVRSTAPGLSPTDVKVWARFKLAAAREALGDHPGLVFVLDRICGMGLKPREISKDQRESERLEDRLGIGLDLLVRAWGL